MNGVSDQTAISTASDRLVQRFLSGVTVAFDSSKHRVIIRHTLRETFDRELVSIIEVKGNYNTGDVDYWIVERNGEVFPHGKHQYVTNVAEFALQPVIHDAMKD